MFAAAGPGKPQAAEDWPATRWSATSVAMGRKARDKRSRPASPEPSPDRIADEARPGPPPARAPLRPSPTRPGARTFAWATALMLATATVYAGALDNPFLLDDPINITSNPTIQRPLDLVALASDPRAAVTLSLRWNWLAGGPDVTGYHVLNVVAHALTGLLVFALARATLLLEVFRGRYARSADHLAAIAALVFLLHPIQTESVTYVIQRAEIFVAAALVGCVLGLLAMRDRPRAGAIAVVAGSCVLGVYSKPSFAVAPALLLVFDVLLLGGSSIVRRSPVYVLTAAAAAATFAISRAHGSFSSATAGFDIEGITPLAYLAAQPGVLVQYLRVTLWPSSLCFDCGYRGPWPVVGTVLGDSVLLPTLALAAITAAALVLRRRQPIFAFAVVGSAIVLAPTSSVIPLADFYVEHRLYLPIAFLAIAMVTAAHDVLHSLAVRLGTQDRWMRTAGAAVAALVVSALGVATIQRNELLADPIALMEDAVRQAPQNERAHYNLANYYKRAGRLDEAIPHYEAAIRLLPNVVRSYQNLGSLYLQQRKPEKALEVYLAGAAAKPDVAMAHRNVANTYLQLDRPAEALEAARRALAIEPRSVNGRRLAGDALLALGRADEAAAEWRAGLAAAPGDPTLTARLAALERP